MVKVDENEDGCGDKLVNGHTKGAGPHDHGDESENHAETKLALASVAVQSVLSRQATKERVANE
jgi:hypothetical protein